MSRNRRHKLKAEMNVVPYIDVMLVLLVIFMIAAPLIHQQSIEIDLPDTSSDTLEMPADAGNDTLPLILSVDASGSYYLNRGNDKQPLLPEDVTAEHPDLPVLVQGDTNANYNRVIDGIVLLQQGGAKKVGLVTEQPPENVAGRAQ